MGMSRIETGPDHGSIPNSESHRAAPPSPIDQLSERQRSYLRLVLQLKTSKEIAAETGTSPRAVDKQLLKANSVLGVTTRFQAAQMLAALEQGVEPLPGVIAPSSSDARFELSRPWPTAGVAVNMLPWKQVAAWMAIISIVTPVGLTAVGMAFFTLLLLLGLRPY